MLPLRLQPLNPVASLYHRDLDAGASQVIDLASYEAALRASEDSVPAFG